MQCAMSNSETAIRVDNLSKRYRIGLKDETHETFAGALLSWLKSPATNFRRLRHLSHFNDARESDADDVIWALRDVSFEVKRGEVLGIIGKNGAGKSTLLKILSRIAEPTSGRVSIHGRVASLLEVGTGFHPDLTGRENVYLNGTILGMSKKEVDRKFDEIVDFSGVEKFIDTPVKRYSSGMRVRLGFSVAAHLEPEVLLLDEVLAVGDAQFQNKCLGKMERVAKGGHTVLFVSHRMPSVRKLCHCALHLDGGRAVSLGRAVDVVEQYLSEFRTCEENADTRKMIRELRTDPRLRLLSVAVTQGGVPTTVVHNGDAFEIAIQYEVVEMIPGLRALFDIRDEDDNILIRSFHDEHEKLMSQVLPGRYVSVATVPAELLAPRRYFAVVTCGHPGGSLTGNGITIPLDVGHTSPINACYPGRIVSKLQPHIDWETRTIEE